MNKRILLSLVTVVAVLAIVSSATIAYYSDTEKSTGNTFMAGSIDLEIDNESYYNGEYQPGTSWALDDLTDQLFFNFTDLKPGDWGEDTVSLHVESNKAWACANITLTESKENGMTNPESKVDSTWGQWGGELDDNLSFVFWIDDGDNVWEQDEQKLMSGKASDLPQDGTGVTYTLADSEENNVGGSKGDPLCCGSTYHIGKAWCFGEMSINRAPEAAYDGPTDDDVPDNYFTCDGSNVGNESQTDTVKGDITFYAEQYRNNPNFTCDSWTP
ncbi:hypothetical protein B5M47_03315 [candidate division CPR3 bacterium 4484_211]|uniref:SipW-cognate class signal peptide n=1 Tax=candidate division CPR3 bacterium 4484_211 TaxID=1968527 RepID=A0A1W9NX40_UNCC3|nr:MAG: hypothetical protein B5M47_03315 [candidate division CPR3 bacterium 4484_211]